MKEVMFLIFIVKISSQIKSNNNIFLFHHWAAKEADRHTLELAAIINFARWLRPAAPAPARAAAARRQAILQRSSSCAAAAAAVSAPSTTRANTNV